MEEQVDPWQLPKETGVTSCEVLIDPWIIYHIPFRYIPFRSPMVSCKSTQAKEKLIVPSTHELTHYWEH